MSVAGLGARGASLDPHPVSAPPPRASNATSRIRAGRRRTGRPGYARVESAARMARRVTFSRNFTLSLSRTCRCYCKYCAFATHKPHLYAPEEVERLLDRAATRHRA